MRYDLAHEAISDVLTGAGTQFHGDFFVIVATVIPVMYLAVGVRFGQIAGVYASMNIYKAIADATSEVWILGSLMSLYAKFIGWSNALSSGVLLVFPMGSVALATYSLMTFTDAPWMRWFDFVGLLVVLALGLIPALASMIKTSDAEHGSVASRTGIADELTKLAVLRDQGALSNEEFEKEKQRLL